MAPPFTMRVVECGDRCASSSSIHETERLHDATITPTARRLRIKGAGGEHLLAGVPQPLQLSEETPEVVRDQSDRVRRGFGVLRRQLETFRPDALVMLGADNGRVFTQAHVPQFATFLGEEIWGSTRLAELGEEAEDDIVRLQCAGELASFAHRELVGAGFDLNYSQLLRPVGQPEYGTAPAFVAPAHLLMPQLDIPVLPIYVNCRSRPAPSGARCYAFGRTLAEVLSERPERIALFASGGLSHDHGGARSGWVDVPFDEWALDHLARGKGAALQPIFEMESDSHRGGSAELRVWTIVAGACEALGSKAWWLTISRRTRRQQGLASPPGRSMKATDRRSSERLATAIPPEPRRPRRGRSRRGEPECNRRRSHESRFPPWRLPR
ncbi:MAG: hypothetical protein GEU73_14290 [Chloroflexi bacterium]|nr:hypothetical protein [Chloroflexota bacterium]